MNERSEMFAHGPYNSWMGTNLTAVLSLSWFVLICCGTLSWQYRSPATGLTGYIVTHPMTVPLAPPRLVVMTLVVKASWRLSVAKPRREAACCKDAADDDDTKEPPDEENTD